MRKITTLLMTTIILACGQPDESLSGDFVLDSGGGILLSMNGPVSSPVFSYQDQFWTARESDKRILSSYNLDGVKEDSLYLYYSPAPDRIGEMDLSSDGSTTFLTMIDDDDLTTNEIATLQFATGDYDNFFLNSTENYVLSNPANVYTVDLDYDNGSELIYLGNYYDTVLETVDQSVYIFELGVGLSSTIAITQNLSYDSDYTVQGEAALCVDGLVDDTGYFTQFAVGIRTEVDDEAVCVFKIYGTDGSENYDSTGEFEFQDIGGLQWTGEESMVLCVKSDERWKIVSGDSSGTLHTLYTADSDVYSMEGLDLSPDGDRCITRVCYDESGENNAILVLSLN